MLRSLPRLGRALFALTSSLTVLLCGLAALAGRTPRIMASSEQQSFGLTFAGRPGAFLALAEGALVLLALGMARGSGRRARLCGWLLVVWAMLWTLNGLRWLVAAPDGMSLGIFAGLAVSLLCTVLATRPPRVPLAD